MHKQVAIEQQREEAEAVVGEGAGQGLKTCFKIIIVEVVVVND